MSICSHFVVFGPWKSREKILEGYNWLQKIWNSSLFFLVIFETMTQILVRMLHFGLRKSSDGSQMTKKWLKNYQNSPKVSEQKKITKKSQCITIDSWSHHGHTTQFSIGYDVSIARTKRSKFRFPSWKKQVLDDNTLFLERLTNSNFK